MDTYREHPSDFEANEAADSTASHDVAAAIGTDERGMHVRAYNYWVSLLDGRPFPSIRDLDPQTIDDFGPNSVLLDFTEGADGAKVAWLGRALREECDLLGDIRRISDVPKRSLLSRLTDHYMQIIANQAPIGFEAEFVGQRGQNTMYRGILMPFSSDGAAIVRVRVPRPRRWSQPRWGPTAPTPSRWIRSNRCRAPARNGTRPPPSR